MTRFERGSVLVTSLLMLLILSLLTLTGLQNSTLEARLTGDLLRREAAFSAAESALAASEQTIIELFSTEVDCLRRDEMGLLRSPDLWFRCLETGIAPCTQGWCGPQAEPSAIDGCTSFAAQNDACWAEAPEVVLPLTQLNTNADADADADANVGTMVADLKTQGVVKLSGCDAETAPPHTVTCRFEVTARSGFDRSSGFAGRVVLQSQFDVCATPIPDIEPAKTVDPFEGFVEDFAEDFTEFN